MKCLRSSSRTWTRRWKKSSRTGSFDLVLERGAVIDVKPQFDITRQVIERMNKLR